MYYARLTIPTAETLQSVLCNPAAACVTQRRNDTYHEYGSTRTYIPLSSTAVVYTRYHTNHIPCGSYMTVLLVIVHTRHAQPLRVLCRCTYFTRVRVHKATKARNERRRGYLTVARTALQSVEKVSFSTRRFAPRAAYAARYACSGRKNGVKRTKKGSCLIVSASWRLENAKSPAAMLQENNPQTPHA